MRGDKAWSTLAVGYIYRIRPSLISTYCICWPKIKMEGSSKHHHHHHNNDRLAPPSPIDEEYPPTPSPRTNASPISSPWIRKPDPERRVSLPPPVVENHPHALPDPGDDVEAGDGAAEQKTSRKMICGCSKSTFIILLFFLIVIIAAAIGGGVGGTIFANKKFVFLPSPFFCFDSEWGLVLPCQGSFSSNAT